MKQPKLPQMDKVLYQWFTTLEGRKTCNLAYNNWKCEVFLWCHENNWPFSDGLL
jgi:hypothetical protein